MGRNAVVELGFLTRDRHDQLRRQVQPLDLEPGQREIGGGIDHAAPGRALGEAQRVPGIVHLERQPRHAADILGRGGFGQMQEKPLPQIGLTGGKGPDPGLKDGVLAQIGVAPLRQRGLGPAGDRQVRVGGRADAFGGQLAVIAGLHPRRRLIGRHRGIKVARRVMRPTLPV